MARTPLYSRQRLTILRVKLGSATNYLLGCAETVSQMKPT